MQLGPSHGRVESLPSISGYLLWRVLKTGFGWQGPSLSYSMAVAYLLFYVVCLYMCGGWSASAFQHACGFLVPCLCPAHALYPLPERGLVAHAQSVGSRGGRAGAVGSRSTAQARTWRTCDVTGGRFKNSCSPVCIGFPYRRAAD